MSDWCAWFEGCLLRLIQVFEEKRFTDLNDEEFERLLLQLRRIRKREWKEGQI
jgi:hypothetical protein